MTNAQLMELAIAEQRKLVMATGGFQHINPEDAQKTDTIGLAATLYGYSLEQPAKQLIPFLPAWVQSLPRQVMGTGLVAEYRRITSVAQTGKSTAAEGTRGAAVTIVTDKPTVSMGNLSSGLFDVTLEAQYAAGTFEDALARATTLSLLQARRSETAHILGGNVTALGSVGRRPLGRDRRVVCGRRELRRQRVLHLHQGPHRDGDAEGHSRPNRRHPGGHHLGRREPRGSDRRPDGRLGRRVHRLQHHHSDQHPFDRTHLDSESEGGWVRDLRRPLDRHRQREAPVRCRLAVERCPYFAHHGRRHRRDRRQQRRRE